VTVARRRLLLRATLLLGAVALSAWLARTGRAHTLFLDNRPAAVGGVEHPALESPEVSVDGGTAEELERGERAQRQVAGPSHRVTVEVRATGRRVERSFELPFGWDAAVLSLPAALAGAAPEAFLTRWQPPPPEEAPVERMLQQQDSAIVPLAPQPPARP